MADEKAQGLNQMWFHPVNGSYIIVNTTAEIPEGFIKNFVDCSGPETDKYGQPFRCNDFTVPENATKAAPKDEVKPKAKVKPKGKAKKPAQAPKGPTLKSLDLSRAEAEDILNEDNIAFDDTIADDEIAALVSGLLEDGEG